MATTKTNRRAARSRSTTTTGPRQARSPANPSLTTRAGKAIKQRPVASAAIATGLVSGIAAAVAGFFAFKKSGKSFADFSGDLAASVKDKASETSERVKDGLTDAGTRAKDQVARLRDGIDSDGKSQSEIAEEALTLKETGTKSRGPRGPIAQQDIKSGMAVG